MLHDTRDQDVFAVAYCIDFDFFTHQVFIYKDRVLLCDLVDHTDVLFYVLVTYSDSHTLAAKYVGRTNQNRITKFIGCFLCFLCCKYSVSLWSRDLALLKDLVKELTVLCCVYVLSRCSKNLHAHLCKCFCQFNRCLSTELYNCSIRFLDIYYILNIFRCQRLEIQFVCDIEVCTYCFRVVVDDNCLIAFFCKCPCTVYGTEVKLDTLTDTDRAGTKYQDFLLIRC